MTNEEILKARLNGLGHWTGNTPLLAIDFSFDGKRRVLYAKAEHLNMTGSIKDRMALHILRRGYERGTLAARRDRSSKRPAATRASRSRPSAGRSAIR